MLEWTTLTARQRGTALIVLLMPLSLLLTQPFNAQALLETAAICSLFAGLALAPQVVRGRLLQSLRDGQRLPAPSLGLFAGALVLLVLARLAGMVGAS